MTAVNHAGTNWLVAIAEGGRPVVTYSHEELGVRVVRKRASKDWAESETRHLDDVRRRSHSESVRYIAVELVWGYVSACLHDRLEQYSYTVLYAPDPMACTASAPYFIPCCPPRVVLARMPCVQVPRTDRTSSVQNTATPESCACLCPCLAWRGFESHTYLPR